MLSSNFVSLVCEQYLLSWELVVLVPGPKRWLILEVSLTHIVESRHLLFLEAEIIDNIFQWDVLTNMRLIKGYDETFLIIRTLTVKRFSK